MYANENHNPVYTDITIDLSRLDADTLLAYAISRGIILSGIIHHYQRHCTCMHDNPSYLWQPDGLDIWNRDMTLADIHPIILN